MSKQFFLNDVKKLRDRARQHIEQGAITPGYEGDQETVIKILNTALATQFAATLEETCDQIAAWRPLLADSVSARYPAVLATASR